jgi:UDP-glucose 4-epimerase
MMAKRKILVTGGAGYIGSHTVVELANAGFVPIIVDDFSNSEKSAIAGIEKIIGQAVKLHIGDCNNSSFLHKVFKEEEDISGVIHFAAFKAVGESVNQPLKYYQNNIGSLLSVLEAMKTFNIEDIVFSSSCTIYGEPVKLPVTESSPVQKATSPYGNTKQICEEILCDEVNSLNGNCKAIALRYFNPIGAHPSASIGELPLGSPNNLVPYVTQTAVGLRKELTVFGDDYNTADGTCVRDYIHVVDLAKAHVKSIDYLSQRENISLFDSFNIGTGKGNSVMEVIHTFEQISGVKLQYTIGPRRTGDVEKVYGDVNKAEKILNWKANLTLNDALIDAWKWQKQQ